MTIRTGLDMAAKRCGATLHDGVGGSANVGGQGMALLIGRKRVLEDRLERDERHRYLRTRGRRRASGCLLQYHAHYPRDKRLVQTGVIGNSHLSITTYSRHSLVRHVPACAGAPLSYNGNGCRLST